FPWLRPLDLSKTKASGLLARLKLDEESPDCWGSLIQLQSHWKDCSSRMVRPIQDKAVAKQFQLSGQSCCQAIPTISHRCRLTMIDALAFTTEESQVIEG
ncbi:hypothetical protein Godav_013557, partial [Gossypium davidsonii]|nr:hypothetical protein [Gossypium davidsonii]MBA0673127.1 hypothetical protein [Gossypium klotzschianum]